MAKKEYINRKTGQRTTNPVVAKNTGATEVRKPKTQTFQVDNKQVSEEEFGEVRKERQHQKEINKILAEGGRGPEQRITEKEKLTPTEIPEAQELGPAVTSVEGLDVGQEGDIIPKTSVLLDTPFGRATAGKVALEELEKQGKTEGYVAMTKYMLETGATPKSLTNDPTAQFILSLKLNENDLKLLKSGDAEIDDLAILMEGLPLKGLGVGKFVTTIPSDRIAALNMKIEKVGNTIRDYRMAAARTPANKDKYLTLIEKSEDKIRNAESRIKLMIIQSPHYQNAPEEVEVIQENTNRALNRIGDAKAAISGGETLEQSLAFNSANPL